MCNDEASGRGYRETVPEKVKFCEVEIEECPNLAVKYGADIVPTLVMFKNGTVKARMQGTVGENILEKRVRELL